MVDTLLGRLLAAVDLDVALRALVDLEVLAILETEVQVELEVFGGLLELLEAVANSQMRTINRVERAALRAIASLTGTLLRLIKSIPVRSMVRYHERSR